MSRVLGVLAICCAMVIAACKRSDSEEKNVRHDYETEGWQFFEYFGTPVEDAILMTSMSSATGAMKAFAFDGTNRTEKEYVSDTVLFRIAAFQSPNSGASYCMIFQKKK